MSTEKLIEAILGLVEKSPIAAALFVIIFLFTQRNVLSKWLGGALEDPVKRGCKAALYEYQEEQQGKPTSAPPNGANALQMPVNRSDN